MIHFSWANPNLLEAQNFSNVKFKKCCKYTEIFDSSSYECVPRKIKHQMIEDGIENTTSPLLNLTLTYSEDENMKRCDQQSKMFSVFKIGEYNERISREDECVDFINNSKDLLLTQQCLKCPAKQPCVNFCCPENFVFEDGKCKTRNDTSDNLLRKYVKTNNYTYVTTELLCDGGEIPDVWSQHLWKITESGLLIGIDEYRLNQYCIEQTQNKAIVCPKYIWPQAKVIVLSMSIACIVIIIIINCVSEEFRGNPATAIKIPLLFFLALTFLLWLINEKFRRSLRRNVSCVLVGFLLQFSTLSTFFWLTCLSVDVWLRFRKINDLETTEISRNHLYYSVSILGPSLITLITMVLQFVAVPEEANYIHPRYHNNIFSEKSCKLNTFLNPKALVILGVILEHINLSSSTFI